MKKYFCLHGHFYQPPRENPWLETIEHQDSAHPYHDWNEKIAEECYIPNAKARILNDKNEVISVINNYEKISFNFGPTLISWIKAKKPTLLHAIQAADRESMKRLGHGNALAQAYSHMILPLANERDKFTQIYWGMQSFIATYSRQPEGLWLPETAVDTPTLEILASLGIKYTILSPHQAAQIRKFDNDQWQDVTHEKINPKMPYLYKLPSGKSIAIFFFDGPLSQSIAFDQTQHIGNHLENILPSIYSSSNDIPAELVNIATDGETFGHHHPFGDMGLAYLLHLIENNPQIELTNYSQYLAMYPPTYEVKIIENSSWSCIHGVERWKSNCGCKTGPHPEWQQEWRTGLRNALDNLRDKLIPIFEIETKKYYHDPWQLRNDYIEVIENRCEDNLKSFLAKHSLDNNSPNMPTLLKWLELQRYTMLMYTSCGWFFEEISGLETTQILKYAARVLQLAAELGIKDLENSFLEILSSAVSNIVDFKNGREIFEKQIMSNFTNKII